MKVDCVYGYRGTEPKTQVHIKALKMYKYFHLLCFIYVLVQ